MSITESSCICSTPDGADKLLPNIGAAWRTSVSDLTITPVDIHISAIEYNLGMEKWCVLYITLR